MFAKIPLKINKFLANMGEEILHSLALI